jgi:hypothetical protein
VNECLGLLSEKADSNPSARLEDSQSNQTSASVSQPAAFEEVRRSAVQIPVPALPVPAPAPVSLPATAPSPFISLDRHLSRIEALPPALPSAPVFTTPSRLASRAAYSPTRPASSPGAAADVRNPLLRSAALPVARHDIVPAIDLGPEPCLARPVDRPTGPTAQASLGSALGAPLPVPVPLPVPSPAPLPPQLPPSPPRLPETPRCGAAETELNLAPPSPPQVDVSATNALLSLLPLPKLRTPPRIEPGLQRCDSVSAACRSPAPKREEPDTRAVSQTPQRLFVVEVRVFVL